MSAQSQGPGGTACLASQLPLPTAARGEEPTATVLPAEAGQFPEEGWAFAVIQAPGLATGLCWEQRSDRALLGGARPAGSLLPGSLSPKLARACPSWALPCSGRPRPPYPPFGRRGRPGRAVSATPPLSLLRVPAALAGSRCSLGRRCPPGGLSIIRLHYGGSALNW